MHQGLPGRLHSNAPFRPASRRRHSSMSLSAGQALGPRARPDISAVRAFEKPRPRVDCEPSQLWIAWVRIPQRFPCDVQLRCSGGPGLKTKRRPAAARTKRHRSKIPHACLPACCAAPPTSRPQAMRTEREHVASQQHLLAFHREIVSIETLTTCRPATAQLHWRSRNRAHVRTQFRLAP